MLNFEQKIAILSSFPELERKNVSMGRVNFHYEESAYEKKTVGFHFHPNGNGFVYAGRLQGYRTDDKGFVNIRDYDEEALRELVRLSIDSLTDDQPAAPREGTEEIWRGPNRETLALKYEDDMWYVFAGLNLDAAFETYGEARAYLLEEGFTKQ